MRTSRLRPNAITFYDRQMRRPPAPSGSDAESARQNSTHTGSVEATPPPRTLSRTQLCQLCFGGSARPPLRACARSVRAKWVSVNCYKKKKKIPCCSEAPELIMRAIVTKKKEAILKSGLGGGGRGECDWPASLTLQRQQCEISLSRRY